MKYLPGLLLIVSLIGSLIACDSAAVTSDAGPQVPACPLEGGAQVFSGYAVCGGDCTRVHEEGECTPGYLCTCSGACVWFETFPQDAGAEGCGLFDASHPDASLDASR